MTVHRSMRFPRFDLVVEFFPRGSCGIALGPVVVWFGCVLISAFEVGTMNSVDSLWELDGYVLVCFFFGSVTRRSVR